MQNKLKQLEKKYSIDWRNEKAGNYFEVRGNPQLNKDSFNFSENGEYPYFTRTVLNNGVAGYVDYLNEEHKISGNSIAVGMLGMQFFYMERDFYAGQFTKTLFPRFEGLNRKNVDYFISLLNKHQVIYQGSLVRHFEKLFNETELKLPFTHDKLNLDYIEEFISTLEAERLATLEAYLKATGLKDVELSEAEAESLLSLETTGGVEWKQFPIIELFTVKNTHNILSRDIIKNSGKIPYLTASKENNSVGTYISYDESQIEEGNSIFIGGKTFVVTYQENDYFSNDSHNLALYFKDDKQRTLDNQLFFGTSIYKSLSHKYSWGDSISNKKIQTDNIKLPINSKGIPDYNLMNNIICATKKIVIKNVIEWLDERIEATKQVISK